MFALIAVICLGAGAVYLKRNHGWHGLQGLGGRHSLNGKARGQRALSQAFRRLNTTPAQEREIMTVVDDFKLQATQAKEGWSAIRQNLVETLYDDVMDEQALKQNLSRESEKLVSTQEALSEAYSRVFKILEPEQRRLLGDIIRGRARFCVPRS